MLRARGNGLKQSDLSGRLGLAATPRMAAVVLAFCGMAALSACTTVEGTNAMTDIGTFEREVMSETLRGVGMLDREEKPELEQRRAPLVLPKDGGSLPAPAEVNTAALPENSDSVQIDATGLTEEELRRLRAARVVDLRSLSGRPLTQIEANQLSARMQATRRQSGQRSLILPPDEYFTTVGGKDLVCLADNGDLVPLDDPACPPAIRTALQQN